jgi:hypothetical protein
MIPGILPYDGVFDADLATVQRAKSSLHVTGRDLVTVEDVLLAFAEGAA